MDIHPTAVVDPNADLAPGVVVHPYCIIGPHVKIGEGTTIGPHAVIDGWTTIGARNRIHPFVSIGQPPQDVTYCGEETRVVIGDDNIIREYVSIHRGTVRGGGVTRVANHNFLMALVHIAHDCVLGSHVILANGVMLAGHVHIDDHAVLGGLVGVHQFVRIGTHAYVGGMSGVSQDIPPYTLVAGEHAKLHGLNLVGLKRRDVTAESVRALKKSYKVLFRSKLTTREAIQQIRDEGETASEVETLLRFMEHESNRGVMRK
jgi:UDP-N-acetylglucosamine acyltransferase